MCLQAGKVNDKLYVLQSGRLTSYISTTTSGHKHIPRHLPTNMVRLHTTTRGAYVNENSLFHNMPALHTIIADRKSILLSISRESMVRMEAENPGLALQIMRTVLMHTSTILVKSVERGPEVIKRPIVEFIYP